MFRPPIDELSPDMGPGMGPGMDELDELQAQRMHETIALDQGAAQPGRFHEFASTLTPPGARSPLA